MVHAGAVRTLDRTDRGTTIEPFKARCAHVARREGAQRKGLSRVGDPEAAAKTRDGERVGAGLEVQALIAQHRGIRRRSGGTTVSSVLPLQALVAGAREARR